MTQPNRRDILQSGAALAIPPALLTFLSGCNRPDPNPAQAASADDDSAIDAPASPDKDSTPEGDLMKVRYLEIVTPDADVVLAQYEKLHGIKFGEPDPSLGGARTAKLEGGGTMAIRGPMHDGEKPVVRPYVLVEDIKASVEQAAAAGGEIAVPPMPIPGHGTCAIFFLGGIECGLWQDE